MSSQSTIQIPEQLSSDISATRLLKAQYKLARYYIHRLYWLDERYQLGGDSALAAVNCFDRDGGQIDSVFQWAQSYPHLGYPIDMMYLMLADGSSNIYAIRISPVKRIQWLRPAIKAALRHKLWQALSALVGNLGTCYIQTGDYKRGSACLNRALALNELHGSTEQSAVALHAKANMLMYKGQPQEAVEVFEQALEKSNADVFSATVRIGLCNALLNLHRFRDAIDHLNVASTVAERTQKPDILIAVWNSRGTLFQLIGRYKQAVDAWKHALEIAQSIGDISSEAFLLNNIAAYEFQQQNFADSINSSIQAAKKALEIGDKQTLLAAYSNLGQGYTFTGEFESALEYLFKAVELEQVYENAHEIGRNLFYIAQIYMQAGDFDGAHRYLLEARNRVDTSDAQGAKLLGQINDTTNFVNNLKQRQESGENPCVELKPIIPTNLWQSKLEQADDWYERASQADYGTPSLTIIQAALQLLEEAISVYRSLGLDKDTEKAKLLQDGLHHKTKEW
jgi:tetratricopeptide (TPR) repeat protein